MREYQPVGVLMAAANGNYMTYASNASTDPLPSPCESEIRSPMYADSPFSLLNAAASSSTLSIVSPTQQCDWPEFQESYNSIMDNTNLLDSCAAALNDINSDEGSSCSVRRDRIRNDFNRSLSTSTTNSSLSECETTNSKCVEQYTRWLCEMENRVAAQPKLTKSKIAEMKPKQLAAQLDIHSNIFKEIVARPFNIKGITRKSIEDRYHLLYLKVYEVLLLLEGLPTNTLSPSKRILSESFNDHNEYDSSVNTPDQYASDHIDSSNEYIDIEFDEKTDCNVTTPVYTETNVMSTSIGTYYFNYDDSIKQQADSKIDGKLNSSFECNDKEFTFENDLNSLFNADSLYLKSQDHALAMPQHLAQSSMINSCVESGVSLAHHKVYDWLHTNSDSSKSKSSVNPDGGEYDYQLLYRAKSEMDLSTVRPIESSYLTSSLRTSLNCLPSLISPIKRYEPTLNDSITEENSLIWDNYQTGQDSLKTESEFGMLGSEMDSSEMGKKLCYFGENYSNYLNETSLTESDISLDIGANGPNATNEIETVPASSESSPKLRRSRRIRKKRAKLTSNAAASKQNSVDDESHSTLTSEKLSETGLSDATTASIDANVPTADEFSPDKTISYNSTEKEFELHSKESAEPKKMKINEMRPEDFYDIVKMCQRNIDCVITVLGADPNRTLTVAYCQQMKFERYQKSNTETCKCKQEPTDAHDLMVNGPRTKDIECKCSNSSCSSTISTVNSNGMCVCAWVSHTIAMILNFLIDCWNVFRNMKLYTYLCRVTKALFGSTRYVADHLKSKRELTKALKCS